MLTFNEIVERTMDEVETLKYLPLGSEFEEFEIEDEQERARLIKQAEVCLENLRKTMERNKYLVERRYQKRSILFIDDFMD